MARALTPGDEWNIPGREYILTAASLPQARLVFRPLREALEPMGGFRFIDSITRVGITHVQSNTRLRVQSSDPKTAQGIVGCPLLVGDEPGAWKTVGGSAMHDTLATAQGKPGARLRVIYIGTLAPAVSGWWHDLVAAGSKGSTYVQALQGDPKKWDQWPEIRRCTRCATSRRRSAKSYLRNVTRHVRTPASRHGSFHTD